MKRYMGSMITAFAAVITPCFIVIPPFLSVFVLCSEFSSASVFILIVCICCSVVWTMYAKQQFIELYTWGVFKDGSVEVKVAFSDKYTLRYENCKSIGIGFYTHGLLNSKFGSRVYFIFLSYDRIEEKYKSHINLWKQSKTQVKVRFDPMMYKYLISVLPPKQANSLETDYRKLFGKNG